MPLAPGAELGDELLGLVELSAEPIPLFRRAPREPLARVARIDLADRGHALPLLRPELRDGRRPLPRAVSASPSPSGPHESNLWGTVPDRRGANQRPRARRGCRESSSIDSLAAAPELAADDAMAAVSRSPDTDHRSAAQRAPGPHREGDRPKNGPAGAVPVLLGFTHSAKPAASVAQSRQFLSFRSSKCCK